MKRMTVLLTLLLMPTLALFAGKPGSAQQTTLTVSCSICSPGQTVTISGSGFGSKATVAFHIYGPQGVGMTLTANRKGQFSVSYPTAVNAQTGIYTASATSSSASATADFEIQ